jgi:uncharacterized membrane protein YphA (DoxX/SURF4 family)
LERRGYYKNRVKDHPMNKYLIPFVRVSLGLVFLASGIGKLLDLQAFESAINNFVHVPIAMAQVISVVVPSIEVSAGAFLSLGLLIKHSAALLMALLLVFIEVIIPHLTIGSEVDCGCFGNVLPGKVNGFPLVRDFVMLGISLVVYLHSDHKFALDNLILRKGNHQGGGEQQGPLDSVG